MSTAVSSWQLSEDDLNNLLIGAAIYGGGGGGSIEEARQYLNLSLKFGPPRLVSAASLPGTTSVSIPYRIGSTAKPKTSESPPVLHALRYAKELGSKPQAMAAVELGAVNPMIAVYCAAAIGVPLLDGDDTGRAVPELEQTLLPRLGIPPDQVIAVTSAGEKLVLTNPRSDAVVDTILRAVSSIIDNATGVIGRVQPLSLIEKGIVPGSISQAIRIGAKWKEALRDGADIAVAVAKEAGGVVLFRGTITKTESREENGFSVGELEISDARNRVMRISSKNENLAAFLDGEVCSTIPDIICLLEEKSGTVMLNIIQHTGAKVAVVVLPPPDLYLTEASLSLFGPKYAGVDGPFRSAIPPKKNTN